MADRLLLDAMCGTLATYLRMCGYDVAYALDRSFEDARPTDLGTDPGDSPSDDALLATARAAERRLVTRDRELADRADDAVLLTTREVTDQLRELRSRGYDLALPDEPARCSDCNGRLDAVDADCNGRLDAVDAETPAYAPDPTEVDVWRCPDCGQCFWRGSHWDDVAETLSDL